MEHSSTEQIVWTHRRKSWIQPCSSFHLIIKIPILRNIYPIFKHSQTKENHGLSCLNSYGWSQNTHKITMFHTFSSPNKYTNRFLGIVWKYPKSNGSWFIPKKLAFFLGLSILRLRPRSKACLGPPRWVRQRSSGTVQRPVAAAGSQGESWGVWGPLGVVGFPTSSTFKNQGNLVGGWPTPSEKYDESSVGLMTFPIYGK